MLPTAPVHLDAASGAPLHPQARAALIAALEQGWADADRRYSAGRRSRRLRDDATEATAAVLGARADEVSFVAGDDLASSLGVLGAAAARRRHGDVVVHSAVEHSAVLHAAGARTARAVEVDPSGRIDLSRWGAEVAAPGVALACLQSANGEVGTVQPVADAAQACARAGVPLLVDATASLGRASLPPEWSVLTGSARGIGGPAGVSLLVVRTGTRFRAPLPGDARVPAAPLPLVVATAVALQVAAAQVAEQDARLRPMVDRVRDEVRRRVPGVDVVGDPVGRLPHVVTFSCLYVDGASLADALDAEGFAVGSGSACTSSTLAPSHVLAAMGALTGGNVRLSLGRDTGEDDLTRFLAVLPRVVADLRRAAGVGDLL